MLLCPMDPVSYRVFPIWFVRFHSASVTPRVAGWPLLTRWRITPGKKSAALPIRIAFSKTVLNICALLYPGRALRPSRFSATWEEEPCQVLASSHPWL